MNKQHILDEIKRTASANGGVPLGQARFFNETGIKITDWRGRFWARWGDAVKEAGFEPNALQTAYGETELIKYLIPLIRELNRFPVHTELRMKALDDVTFPSHTVWWTRFGSKQNLTKRVIEYCSTDPDLEDVAVICGSIANAVETRQAQRPEKEEPSFGFFAI